MREFLRLSATGLAMAGLIGFSSTADAADVYAKGGGLEDEAMMAVQPSWAGLYAGGSVGYGWGDVSIEFLSTSPVGGDFFAEDSDDLSGGVYGAHLGYNFQPGNIVFGAEIGINGAAIDGETFFGSFDHDLKWYATAVGRLGYAHDQILIYGFGGVAWGKVDSVLDLGSGAADHVGWTAGLGVEYALSDRLSLRLEYAHVDLGSQTIEQFSNFEGLDVTQRNEIDLDFNVVKVGASYSLGGRDELLK
jgi:outer membrane immunogenic protein